MIRNGFLLKVFFTLFVVVTFPVWSQNTSLTFSSAVSGDIVKTVIKELQFPASISYVETVNEHCFIYHDGVSNNLKKVVIDPSLSVNDFVIADDTVFFCGENAGGMGFFGHFKVSTFFQVVPAYFITGAPFHAANEHVTTFYKMATYALGSSRMLVALARTQNNANMVAAVRYIPSVPYYSYTIGVLPNTYLERLRDITVTDNYVATAGFKVSAANPGQGPQPCIRVYKKNTMFMNGGPQNTANVFIQTSNTVYPFNTSQLVMSHLENDDIALAAYFITNSAHPYDETYIGKYQIDANTNTPIPTASMGTSQSYQTGGWKLHGITKKDNSSYFYLLQHTELSYINQLVDAIFVLEDNLFSTNTPIPLRLQYDMALQSIDARNNYMGFVSNGLDLSNPQRLKYYDAKANAQQCYVQSTLSHNPFYINNVAQQDAFITYQGAENNFITYVGTQMLVQYNIECAE